MNTKLYFLAITLSIVLYGCGPSAAEKADKAHNDEIAEAAKQLAMQDSVAAVGKSVNANEESNNPKTVADITLNTWSPKNRKIIKSGEIKFRVMDVRLATEKIEEVIMHFGGYVTRSDLHNQISHETEKNLENNSYLLSKEIIVTNNISLRIPKEKLDSFLRALNPWIDFLDYRNYSIDDQTFKYGKNASQADRIAAYEKRQAQHIDKKPSRLKETSVAEEQLLDKQLQADEMLAENAELEDKINFCDFQMEIYQKPFILRETYERFDDYGSYKPNVFKRIFYSIVDGWWILEEIVVFLFKLWGIVLLIVAAIVLYKVAIKYNKKDKNRL
jgi:hypothetical protein